MARGITESGYIVTRWTVRPDARRDHDVAVEALLRHTADVHPRITGTVCLRCGWDEYLHIAHIGSLATLEEIQRIEETPECDDVWEDVRRYMVPGTMSITFWSEVGREHWKPLGG